MCMYIYMQEQFYNVRHNARHNYGGLIASALIFNYGLQKQII